MMFDNAFPIVEQVIRSRRTTKNFDGRAVSRTEIERLLNLAVQAPNHRLNEPWRFRGILKSGLQKWRDHLQASLKPEDMKAIQKSFDNLSKAGAVVYCTHERDPDPIVDQENYAATCAGIQNLLLAATALEMQSYWSTGKLMTHPETLKFLEIPPEEKFVGGIWLGWGVVPPAKARTPASEKTMWIE